MAGEKTGAGTTHCYFRNTVSANGCAFVVPAGASYLGFQSVEEDCLIEICGKDADVTEELDDGRAGILTAGAALASQPVFPGQVVKLSTEETVIGDIVFVLEGDSSLLSTDITVTPVTYS